MQYTHTTAKEQAFVNFQNPPIHTHTHEVCTQRQVAPGLLISHVLVTDEVSMYIMSTAAAQKALYHHQHRSACTVHVLISQTITHGPIGLVRQRKPMTSEAFVSQIVNVNSSIRETALLQVQQLSLSCSDEMRKSELHTGTAACPPAGTHTHTDSAHCNH